MTKPDDLDYFSQSAHAYLDLEEQKEVLVEEARSVLAAHPTADPVGLLLEATSPVAQTFITATEKATGQKFRAKGFAGVMPRHVAVEILKDQSPELLEMLENEPGGEGLMRRLPMIAVTKDGARMLVVEYEAPEAWRGEGEMGAE